MKTETSSSAALRAGEEETEMRISSSAPRLHGARVVKRNDKDDVPIVGEISICPKPSGAAAKT